MLCTSCASGHQAEFTAEVNLHFDGPKYIDEPGVLMFPKLLVCLDCGFARFVAEKDGIGAPCKQYIGNGDFDTEWNASEASVCRGRVCLSRGHQRTDSLSIRDGNVIKSRQSVSQLTMHDTCLHLL
jgi:hypothetical protein